jgi:hypothetical protein
MPPRPYTNYEFIEKASAKHNNKYDYSYSNYINNECKVKIICPEHGAFFKKAGPHLFGKGCPSCGRKSIGRHTALRNKISHNDFIEKSKLVHNNKYDYSLTKYKNSKNKVIITCRVHGNFTQRPTNHLSGRGCKSCGISDRVEIRKYSAEEFLKKMHQAF